MNCVRVKEILVDYAEGALAGRKRLAVERHLSRCEACRSELAWIEKVRQDILSLETPERDAEFWESFGSRLSQKLAQEENPESAGRSLWWPRLSFAAAGAAVMVFVISLVVLP
ncbi:MAG: zf-HC2 domain-containing protein, partial [Candidatus Hydrogenedentota bacterium]